MLTPSGRRRINSCHSASTFLLAGRQRAFNSTCSQQPAGRLLRHPHLQLLGPRRAGRRSGGVAELPGPRLPRACARRVARHSAQPRLFLHGLCAIRPRLRTKLASGRPPSRASLAPAGGELHSHPRERRLSLWLLSQPRAAARPALALSPRGDARPSNFEVAPAVNGSWTATAAPQRGREAISLGGARHGRRVYHELLSWLERPTLS